MAKFQDKHLKLRYNQRAYFGDNDDCSIWHDGSQMRVSCTVSGVTPTQDYHLTTKQYVDSVSYSLDWQDSVLSMSGTTPPGSPSTGDRYLINVASGTATGAWTGQEESITEWDGAQWDFFPPNEGFATYVEDIDTIYVYSNGQWVRMASIILHGALQGLDQDDHLQYVRADGGPGDSRGFTSTVSGIDPTASYHLTTKFYVDDEIATLSGTIPYDFLSLNDTPTSYAGYGNSFVTVASGADGLQFTTISGLNQLMDHGLLLGLADDDHLQYPRADGGVGDSRGFTATVSGIYPTQSYHLTTKQYVDDQTQVVHESGRTPLALNDNTKDVVFGTSFSGTDYSLSVIMRNSVDSSPSIYPMIVTGTTTSGFSVLFSGDIDSNNYYLDYKIILILNTNF